MIIRTKIFWLFVVSSVAVFVYTKSYYLIRSVEIREFSVVVSYAGADSYREYILDREGVDEMKRRFDLRHYRAKPKG
jgi:hypothetical protein